jgi:hypothetical protein
MGIGKFATFTGVALSLLAAVVHTGPVHAQEITCGQLLVQCGDGPSRQLNENGTISFVGGGTISTQCVGVVSGVLATYRYCHGTLTWAGAAAVLIHMAHSDPKLMNMKGWDCAEAAYAEAFPCQQQ